MLLMNRVTYERIQSDKYIGDRSKEGASGDDKSEPDPLLVASRCHSNFVENVPMALILAGVVELNGGNRKVLTAALSALLVLRIAHVELGMRGKDYLGPGRITGFFGTQGVLAGLAAYSAYLVKGYWGY